jgi:hypothetical protein
VAGPDMHAFACAVPAEARHLVLPDHFEYADAFAITLPPGTRIAPLLLERAVAAKTRKHRIVEEPS